MPYLLGPRPTGWPQIDTIDDLKGEGGVMTLVIELRRGVSTARTRGKVRIFLG